MASTDSTSNNPNQIPFTQAKLQENFKEIPKKPEQRMTLINPIFTYPQLSLNQNNFGSNIVEKKNTIINFPQRINSSHSIKNNPEYDLFNQYSFVPHFPNVNFGMPIMSSQFKSYGLMNSFSHLKDERNLPLKINPNTFMLNSLVNENEEFYKDKKEENKNIIKTKEIFNEKDDEKNNNSEKSSSSEKNNSNNSNTNNLNNINNINNNSNNNNTNTGAKFFTNHNYGYKCSCSKTQCNRKYCECFNSGNYCVDCNCKNCNNKPPVNSYTNKRPTDEQSKCKKDNVICTCTKSGCNKNYCECFKIGQKCTSLCRCIGCENNDQIQSKKYNFNYQCDSANSIYIIKNKIYVENMEEKLKNKILFGNVATMKNYDFAAICKKRKREENKNEEDEKNFGKNIKNKIKKNENEDDINLFNDSLFDNNGKVILRHINLFRI